MLRMLTTYPQYSKCNYRMRSFVPGAREGLPSKPCNHVR
jgi:hypothetical protein